MDIVSISVTEAARNFADCVNRAHYQGTTFMLLKNGKAMARIVPADKHKTGKDLSQDMQEALKEVLLPTEVTLG